MVHTITIPGKLPGMNEIIDGSKTMVWRRGTRRMYKYTQDKRYYTDKIATLCALQRIKPISCASLVVEFKERRMARDPDNVQAGIKFILDGLVKGGCLPDDTRQHITGIEYAFVDGCDADEITVLLNDGR